LKEDVRRLPEVRQKQKVEEGIWEIKAEVKKLQPFVINAFREIYGPAGLEKLANK
jgi:hypothetical protein